MKPFGSPFNRPDKAIFEKRSQKTSEAYAEAILRHGFKKAEEVLSVQEAIDPRSFTNFDPRVIAADTEEVRRAEEHFKQLDKDDPTSERNRNWAKVLEAIIYEQAELGNWFGESAVSILPSRYDDIVNGIDTIIEYSAESRSCLALGIDVTYADPTKKLRRAKMEIENGTLAHIKYYRSSDERLFGSLKHVPRMVLCVDHPTMERVIQTWTSPNGTKDVGNDPVRLQIIEELYMQARAFAKFAERKGQKTAATILQREAARFDALYNEPVLKNMQQDREAIQFRNKDARYKALKAFVEELSRG